MTTADIHALVGAYALNAVDDLERAAFDRHVAGCDSCRAELDELREAAGRLADPAWSVPPRRLRVEVLNKVSRTRQLPPVTSPAAEPVRRADRRRWLVAAAAAVLLAGGTGVAVYAVQEQRLGEQRDLATAAEQHEARTRGILASPDLVIRTARMIGGGKVTLAYSYAQDAGVIMLGADAPPPNGEVFQMWTLRGEQATSAGVLAVGQTTAVQIVEGLPDNDAIGITAEPAGGADQPSLPLVSSVQIV